MKRIYIIRHGETNSNRKNIYNNTVEDINENGVRQAEQLREKMKGLQYDIVYCSPFLRTRHTCHIVNYLNRRVILDDRLKERDCGDLTDLPLNCVDRNELWSYYSKTNIANEEKVPALLQRVGSFLDEMKENEFENILVVAHKGISRAFEVYFNGLPENGIILNLGTKNCEIKEYTFKD